MKKLPIGIQSFTDLRRNNYLYVDKTEHIYRLISSGKYYFLSRPRRFGKSLLISTLAEIFKGNQSLFEGLHIYDKIDWVEYPVIRIDWSNIAHASPEVMEMSVPLYLDSIARSYQIELTRPYAPDRLGELITRLHETTGKQAVVLIDEYDIPILDILEHPDRIRKIRDFLQAFYRVLKSSDEHLRFAFLTGVSKFSKVSIFSGMNNLADITIDSRYSIMCGYTQDEIETYFAGHLEQFAQKRQITVSNLLSEIKSWYNGYSWDGVTSVYNPFSTLLFFDKMKFSNYWFATGTPTFLVDRIKQRNEAGAVLEEVTVPETNFDSAEPDKLDTRQLMFQTGYLTIKKVTDNMFNETQDYTLGIPNKEVKDSLLSHLFADYADCSLSEAEPTRDLMKRQLIEGEQEGFARSLRGLFAHIPYQLHIPREAYYHSLLLLWLKMLGFDVSGEVPTNKGRMDAVWIWKEYAVVAEIKYQMTDDIQPVSPGTIDHLLDEAMNQIKELHYYDRYAAQRHVILLAVAFAGKEIGCLLEKL